MFDERVFIPIADVVKIVPISRATVFRMISRDEFPKPVSFGKRSFWVEAEVRKWIDNQVDGRK